MFYEEEDEYKQTIVIDNGSGYIKAGFCYEDAPRSVFPSIVGYPKFTYNLNFRNRDDFYVGSDAESLRGVLKLNYPIEHGEIKNWDDMEKIWGHIYDNELRVEPEERNILITECSENKKGNRNKITQIMFETFWVPGLYIANPGVLTLLSLGKFEGISIDLGDSLSKFIPIFDGFPLSHAVKQYNCGGRELTEYFVQIIQSYGYNFSTSDTWEIAKNIKEEGCYFTLNYEKEKREPFSYELPDGNNIIINNPEIRCLKTYFKPETYKFMKYGFDLYSSGKICYDSIQKCDIDIRKDLYNNIVLSGGNSLFEGLPEIIEEDIKALTPESMKGEVKVITPLERKLAAWLGGSIISSFSIFENMIITKYEYEEYGSNIIRRKFFS